MHSVSMFSKLVEDVPELLPVHPAEGLADLLSQSIRNAVGVPYSFPLDDLDLSHRSGDLVETLHVNVLRTHSTELMN